MRKLRPLVFPGDLFLSTNTAIYNELGLAGSVHRLELNQPITSIAGRGAGITLKLGGGKSLPGRDAEPEPEPEPESPEPTHFGRSRNRSRSHRNGLLGAGAVKNGVAPAPKRGTIVEK